MAKPILGISPDICAIVGLLNHSGLKAEKIDVMIYLQVSVLPSYLQVIQEVMQYYLDFFKYFSHDPVWFGFYLRIGKTTGY